MRVQELCISQFQQCPSPPPGNPGAFPNVARPGGGAFAYPGAFDTWFQNRGVSRVFVMEAFIGQDVDYVAN